MVVQGQSSVVGSEVTVSLRQGQWPTTFRKREEAHEGGARSNGPKKCRANARLTMAVIFWHLAQGTPPLERQVHGLCMEVLHELTKCSPV